MPVDTNSVTTNDCRQLECRVAAVTAYCDLERRMYWIAPCRPLYSQLCNLLHFKHFFLKTFGDYNIFCHLMSVWPRIAVTLFVVQIHPSCTHRVNGPSASQKLPAAAAQAPEIVRQLGVI